MECFFVFIFVFFYTLQFGFFLLLFFFFNINHITVVIWQNQKPHTQKTSSLAEILFFLKLLLLSAMVAAVLTLCVGGEAHTCAHACAHRSHKTALGC